MIRRSVLAAFAAIAFAAPLSAQTIETFIPSPDYCFPAGPCVSFQYWQTWTSYTYNLDGSIGRLHVAAHNDWGRVYGDNTPTGDYALTVCTDYYFELGLAGCDTAEYYGTGTTPGWTVSSGGSATSIVGASLGNFVRADVGTMTLYSNRYDRSAPSYRCTVTPNAGGTPCVRVPEPSSLLLLATGLLPIALVGWRRRRVA
jgi:hypothetical protein